MKSIVVTSVFVLLCIGCGAENNEEMEFECTPLTPGFYTLVYTRLSSECGDVWKPIHAASGQLLEDDDRLQCGPQHNSESGPSDVAGCIMTFNEYTEIDGEQIRGTMQAFLECNADGQAIYEMDTPTCVGIYETLYRKLTP